MSGFKRLLYRIFGLRPEPPKLGEEFQYYCVQDLPVRGFISARAVKVVSVGDKESIAICMLDQDRLFLLYNRTGRMRLANPSTPVQAGLRFKTKPND